MKLTSDSQRLLPEEDGLNPLHRAPLWWSVDITWPREGRDLAGFGWGCWRGDDSTICTGGCLVAGSWDWEELFLGSLPSRPGIIIIINFFMHDRPYKIYIFYLPKSCEFKT